MIAPYLAAMDARRARETRTDRAVRIALDRLASAMLDLADWTAGVDPRTGRAYHVAPWFVRVFRRLAR